MGPGASRLAWMAAARFLIEETRIFLSAVRFFTRLPVPAWVGYSDRIQNASSRYLPLVGWVVGGMMAIVFWVGQWFFVVEVAVLLAILVGVLATGALHEDGLADVCDAFGGGHDREAIFRIMKDSRLGTFGVLGLGVALGFKFLLLARLADEAGAALLPAFVLVAAQALSRFSAASLLYTHPFVSEREGAKSNAFARRMSLPSLFIAAALGLVPLALLAAWNEEPLLFAVLLAPLAAHLWLGRLFRRRIGGVTGDCAGAMQQITEIAFYLAMQPELHARLADFFAPA